MSNRVRNYDVEHCLMWARNYKEIDNFELLPGGPRKWRITMPDGPPITVSGMEPGFIERQVVPTELVLTSREALTFCYGLALRGARHSESRAAFARREWSWDEDDAEVSS